MSVAKHRPDLYDFWLGFAFGCTGVAAFLAGCWSKGYLLWLVNA
jgi:hypothetical protein